MAIQPSPHLPVLHNFGHVKYPDNWHKPPEDHSFYELILVTHGKLHVEMLGRRYTAKAGYVLVYEPGLEHKEWVDRNSQSRSMFLYYQQEPTTLGVPPFSEDKSRRVRQFMDWIFEEGAAGTDDSLAGRTAGLIQAVLQQLVYHDHNQVPQTVAKVRNYLLQHQTDPITLDDLAELVGVSKHYLTRTFRAATGTTPMAELRTMRLNATRYYLLHTDWTLRVITERVGFNDEFHLSRSFKKQFGVSPRQFRKQLRAKEDSADA